MKTQTLWVVLLGWNLLIFLLLALDITRCKKGKPPFLSSSVLFCSFLLGGALGGCLAYLCFGRVQGSYAKTSRLRDTVLALRLPAALVLVFQLLLLLLLATPLREALPNLSGPVQAHLRPIGLYFLTVNLLAFAAFGLDKYWAIRQKRRIPIKLLFVLAFLGGSVGALLGMYLFRHKTKKLYFTLGIPLILALQLTLCALLLWGPPTL